MVIFFFRHLYKTLQKTTTTQCGAEATHVFPLISLSFGQQIPIMGQTEETRSTWEMHLSFAEMPVLWIGSKIFQMNLSPVTQNHTIRAQSGLLGKAI